MWSYEISYDNIGGWWLLIAYTEAYRRGCFPLPDNVMFCYKRRSDLKEYIYKGRQHPERFQVAEKPVGNK